MKCADSMDRHKISYEFEFRPDRTIDFGVTGPLVQKKKTTKKKKHIGPCPKYSLPISFTWNLMKLADNLVSYKISDVFEFRQDQTIYFGVTCPWLPKYHIVDFVRSEPSVFSSNLYETCR